MNNTATVVSKSAPTQKHIRVQVPSNCVFYPKDVVSVFVRPFHLEDIAALSTAKNSQDIASYVNAIGKTCSIPVEMITQDDFQAICYWHRINSYPTKPLTLRWTCNNPKHLEMAHKEPPVNASEDLLLEIESAKSTLSNRKVFSANHPVDMNVITKERFEKIRAFLTNTKRHSYPHFFLPPTVGDMIELAEITKLALRRSKLEDLELNAENQEAVYDEVIEATSDDLMLELASYLNPEKCGVTLQQRRDFIRQNAELDPDMYNSIFLQDFEEFKALVDHSVKESVHCKCQYRGCEQRVEIPLNFDLFDFFPFV